MTARVTRARHHGAHDATRRYTSLEETVYWLHVPVENDGLERAAKLLAALVLDARISDADVEAERPIVVDEWRASKGWTERAQQKHFRACFAGSKVGVARVLCESVHPPAIRKYLQGLWGGGALRHNRRHTSGSIEGSIDLRSRESRPRRPNDLTRRRCVAGAAPERSRAGCRSARSA